MSVDLLVRNAVYWAVRDALFKAMFTAVREAVQSTVAGTGGPFVVVGAVHTDVNQAVYWSVHGDVFGDQPVRAETLDLLRSMGCDS